MSGALRSADLGPDEARRSVIDSSLRCLHQPGCSPVELAAMLRGTRRRWNSEVAAQAASHRRLLRRLERSGLRELADAEVEGICSAVGLDEGRVENVAVIERESAA